MSLPARLPAATYRLQLQRGFGFAAAAALVDYLAALGVSDLYLSPILAARPGSTHGYDVSDPTHHCSDREPVEGDEPQARRPRAPRALS